MEDTLLFLNNNDGIDVFNGTVTIKGGEISAGKAYGMNIYGANATVSLDGTRINGNTDIGVRFDQGTLEISNAEIKGNTVYGITFFNQGGPSSLKLRNTQVMNNPSVGVYISTSDLASQADLGTAADPGKNTLQGNGTNLNAGGKVSVNASGNTWESNQQGADAAGHYATGVPIAGPTSGTPKNIKVASGITVQL